MPESPNTLREGVTAENGHGHWDVFPLDGWPDGELRVANCLVVLSDPARDAPKEET